jgi:hypothetical protein
MEFFKIVFLCILAAVSYGMIHDQITARICLEYFTVAHPPVFNTESPTLLGLGWGIIATWWVGLFLGVPLAFVARAGQRKKLTACQLVRPISWLLITMAALAFAAGWVGYILAMRGTVQIPDDFAGAIPPGHHVRFMADWWAHSASYLVGFVGGVVLIVCAWRRRSVHSA